MPELKRVPAVDGLALDPKHPNLSLFSGNDFGYRCGVIGCALSHYRLWRLTADECSSQSVSAVFEDDAWFSARFQDLWDTVMSSRLPEDFDLVYLGGLLGPQTWHELESVARDTGGHIEIPPSVYCASQISESFAIPSKVQFCTYSYILSGRGAKKLCDLVTRDGIKKAIDWFLIDRWPELRVYVTTPILCWSVSQEGSDIFGRMETVTVALEGATEC